MHLSPFLFDEKLLSNCVLDKGIRINRGDGCDALFRAYSKHYERDLDDKRYPRFLEHIYLIHEHNAKNDKNHHITLNQFSSLHDYELPLATPQTTKWEDQIDLETNLSIRKLHSLKSILEFSHFDYFHNITHNQSIYFNFKSFEKNVTYQSTIAFRDKEQRRGRKDNSLNDQDDETNFYRSTDHIDKFNLSLNWATKENPDGVSIVHRASDQVGILRFHFKYQICLFLSDLYTRQGLCGSCWAFAATGTLEASVWRRTAFEAYRDILARIEPGEDIPRKAKRKSRITEHNTIKMARLSVQELVDCDTATDQGCTGGNPLLAYSFIRRYGLTSAKNYPYEGDEGVCRVRKVASPIATAQSWGILSTDDEDNMALVLRWIGPIAVGINGSDLKFLAYKEGIYDNQDCSQVANHAILIVGYGKERDRNGQIIRYWIARNSWSESWGENGFIRIKRGSGKRGVPGVCGIAKNPSVALDGILLPLRNSDTNQINDSKSDGSDSKRPLEESRVNNYCGWIGLKNSSTCKSFER
jgi:C1A family cysteine protease